MHRDLLGRLGPPSELLPRLMDADISENDGSTKRNAECGEEDERELPLPVEEERFVGRVKFDVFSTYWKAAGLYVSPAILASLLLMQSSRNISDWWLAHWVSELQNSTNPSFSSSMVHDPSSSYNPAYFLGVYGGIAFANSVFTFLRAFLFAFGGLKAAKFMHGRLIDTILRVGFNDPIKMIPTDLILFLLNEKAKTIFFDMTPLGRILNRLSSDVYTVDDSLPFILNIFLAQLFGLFGNLSLLSWVLPLHKFEEPIILFYRSA